MKKALGLICLVSIVLLMAIPACADFSASLDLTGGDAGSEYYSGSKQTESSNLGGVNLGLGYDEQNWTAGLDFTSASLSGSVGGGNTLTLGDYRVGYRFYDQDPISATALLSYNHESSGDFAANGWTVGVGAKFLMDPGWSMEGRLGYSLLGGVSVKNRSDTYQSPSLWTYGLKINYQISDDWSAHLGIRHYGYSGNSNGQNLKSDTNLYFAGVTYRFGVPNSKSNAEPSAQPAVQEPVPPKTAEPEPQSTPAPETKNQTAVSEPKSEPDFSVQTQPASDFQPQADVDANADENTSQDIPAGNEQKVEKVNNVLQPIFFNFDKYAIRADQVPVLEKDLEILQAHPDLYVLIGGHADQTGKSQYNLKLSAKRANAVKQWLVKHGVDPSRISLAAYGSKYPYKAKSNDPKWESDRWVDIFVTDEQPTEEMGIRK